MILRGNTANWQWHGAALAAYAVFAAGFIDHGKSLTHALAGQGSDPFAFVWFLAWWPWAIGHHINPLYTNLVWQPVGVYLDWVTSVPLLGLAGWPLTRISPVLSYNFFILLGPVLAAFMAYLLCLYITRRRVAAFIGGFLFGYSSYEMGQDTAALNLSFTMFVPALLLIILCRLDNRLRRRGMVLLASLMLICQFLLCIEVFGMVCVFGGIAWLLAMVYLPERRAVLRRLVVDGLCCAPPVLILLSPVLVSMALHADTVKLPSLWPYYFSTDLLNFVIPARTNFLGGAFGAVSGRFSGGVQELDGYIGLPLLLIALLFARQYGREPAARLLLVMFALLAVLSLGPGLWIAGHYTGLVLPWTLFVHLPLVKSALPARFALFVSLCAAIIAASWIARSPGFSRLGLGLLACFALLPSLHPWMKIPTSTFFQPGRVETVLGAQARIMVLPFAINGPSSFWQVENHFGFVQTGGYLGAPPASMQKYPVVIELFNGAENARFSTDIADFCKATHTQFIVMAPGTPPRLQQAIAMLHWQSQAVDDVTVYAVPAAGDQPNG